MVIASSLPRWNMMNDASVSRVSWATVQDSFNRAPGRPRWQFRCVDHSSVWHVVVVMGLASVDLQK